MKSASPPSMTVAIDGQESSHNSQQKKKELHPHGLDSLTVSRTTAGAPSGHNRKQ
jgi:hypothetical protein